MVLSHWVYLETILGYLHPESVVTLLVVTGDMLATLHGVSQFWAVAM